MRNVGEMLIFLGMFIMLSGAAYLLLERWPFWGQLPGDIRFEGRRFTFYAPITTCLLLSVLLTLLLNVFFRWLARK